MPKDMQMGRDELALEPRPTPNQHPQQPLESAGCSDLSLEAREVQPQHKPAWLGTQPSPLLAPDVPE